MKNDQVNSKNLNASLIAPLVAIICFFVLLIGTSFAYHPISQPNTSTDSLVASNYNVTLPKSCSVSMSNTSCILTGSDTALVNRTDSIIAKNELGNISTAGFSVANSSCYLSVNLVGDSNCTCNYSLELVPIQPFTPMNSSIKEFTATITAKTGSGTATTVRSESNLSNILETVLANDKVTISSGSTYVLRRYDMTIRFYNNGYDQAFRSNQKYQYQLRAKTVKCNNKTLTPSLSDSCTLLSGAPGYPGAKYSCIFDDGVARDYYYIGGNLGNPNKVDLLMTNNYTDENVPSNISWCDPNGANPNSLLCRGDGLTVYNNYLNAKFGGDVLVSGPKTRTYCTGFYCKQRWAWGSYWFQDYSSSGSSVTNAFAITPNGNILSLNNVTGLSYGYRPMITIDKGASYFLGDGDLNRYCLLQNGTHLSVGAKYSCTFADGVARDYIYVGDDTYDLNFVNLVSKDDYTDDHVYQNMTYADAFSNAVHVQNVFGPGVFVSLPPSSLSGVVFCNVQNPTPIAGWFNGSFWMDSGTTGGYYFIGSNGCYNTGTSSLLSPALHPMITLKKPS